MRKMEKTESKTSEPEIATYTLERDGDKPLKFSGQELAWVSNQEPSGENQSRWDEYTLYRTTKGTFVIAHEYKTQWQGEICRHEVWYGPDAKDLLVDCGYDDPDDKDGHVLPNLIVRLAREAGIDISETIE